MRLSLLSLLVVVHAGPPPNLGSPDVSSPGQISKISPGSIAFGPGTNLPEPPLDSAGYLNLPSERIHKGFAEWIGEKCFQGLEDEGEWDGPWPDIAPNPPPAETEPFGPLNAKNSASFHKGYSGPVDTKNGTNLEGGGIMGGPWIDQDVLCVNWWDYDGPAGPLNWPLNFPTCGGQRQSPIVIEEGELVPDNLALSAFDLTFVQSTDITITNTGNTIMISYGVERPEQHSGQFFSDVTLINRNRTMFSAERMLLTEGKSAAFEGFPTMSATGTAEVTKKDLAPMLSKMGPGPPSEETVLIKVLTNDGVQGMFSIDNIPFAFSGSERNALLTTDESGNVKNYYLNNIHFHMGTEHVWVAKGQKEYDFEMHYVFTADDGDIYEFGVFLDTGYDVLDHPFFPITMEGYFPQGKQQYFKFGGSSIPSLDFPDYEYFDLANAPLPTGVCGTYACAPRAYYQGSIGVPPCTERTQWSVFKDPVHISLDQMKSLKRWFRHNFQRNQKRPLQPRNGRVVKSFNFEP